jgi:ribosomal protein L21E
MPVDLSTVLEPELQHALFDADVPPEIKAGSDPMAVRAAAPKPSRGKKSLDLPPALSEFDSGLCCGKDIVGSYHHRALHHRMTGRWAQQGLVQNSAGSSGEVLHRHQQRAASAGLDFEI